MGYHLSVERNAGWCGLHFADRRVFQGILRIF
jgi:hypothetical protein